MSRKKINTFLFTFNDQNNAETFLNRVNEETEGWARNMLKGGRTIFDKKTVLVKGTGSLIFDINLKKQCKEFCELLQDGCLVN